MKHPKTVEKYNGTLKELSRDIVGLDYDAQVELFKSLAKDFDIDSIHDKEILHPQVSVFLKNISKWLIKVLDKDMKPMAKICRSYNEKWIR